MGCSNRFSFAVRSVNSVSQGYQKKKKKLHLRLKCESIRLPEMQPEARGHTVGAADRVSPACWPRLLEDTRGKDELTTSGRERQTEPHAASEARAEGRARPQPPAHVDTQHMERG